jgi:TonB family protein
LSVRRAALPLAALLLLARPAVADDEPKVTKPPKLVTFAPAVYPPDKQAAGVTGSVLLTIDIDAAGKVIEVAVATSGGADFDAAAVAAARQFVYEPAEIDGKPGPVTITYRYDFTIAEEIVELKGQVNLEGVVRERFKKTPLRGLKIRLADSGAEATTDEEGRFTFVDVAPGTHGVEVSGAEIVTVSTEEELVKGKKKSVVYLVEKRQEGIDEEEVVRAARIKKESVETTIRTEEARRVPGTQGDTLKVVQNLPGVARSSFGSGQLVVWGSAPEETRVYVDGVEIPRLYHGGGLRSTVNSDLIRSIDLAPGAYGAEYGRGLGGLVRSETQKLPDKGVHGYVAADAIDASGMIAAAASDRLSLAVAGRLSYLDRTLKLVTSDDVNDFVPIPRYHDAQALAALALGKDETLTLIFLESNDRLKRTIDSTDPNEVRSEETEVGFWRVYLHYRNLLADGSSLTITPSFGRDVATTDERFGAVPTTLDQKRWRFGLRTALRRRLEPWITLSAGLDLAFTATEVTRFGTASLPAREGDVTVFGRPPGEDIASDTWTVRTLGIAPFVTTELSFGPLSLAPGLRVEPYLIDGDKIAPRVGDNPPLGYRRLEWGLEPRLSASLRLGNRLTLRAGGGLYHQPPDPADLSSVFGNPQLGLASAVHGTLGAAYRVTPTLTLEMTGFAKSMWDLPSRSTATAPPIAQSLLDEGVGRSFGAQVLLRQELWKGFFGWVTYSLIRSERRDHPGERWRLLDFDQTHILAVLASYQLGDGWELGARFRYATGAPRTPVTSAFFDARDDLYQPIFGAQNSIRIPDFYQLDARLEKAFNFQALKLSVFLDVQNLTNRKNPEEIVYNFDYTVQGSISGLPTLAVIGARVEL